MCLADAYERIPTAATEGRDEDKSDEKLETMVLQFKNVVPVILRDINQRTEILVFKHPIAGIQM